MLNYRKQGKRNNPNKIPFKIGPQQTGTAIFGYIDKWTHQEIGTMKM